MNQTCPQCYALLTSSEVGDLCVQCGYIQRRHHNHIPEPTDHTSNHLNPQNNLTPGSLEAPEGLDSLLFPTNKPDPESGHDAQTMPETSYDDLVNPKTNHEGHDLSSEKPQIINHHTSSQYRKRLQQRLDNLKTPEIESSLEPESSLAAAYPTSYSEKQTEPSQPYDATDTLPANTEPDVIEVNEPHRPSPYLLNMNQDEQESTHQPKYHSPLKTAATTGDKNEVSTVHHSHAPKEPADKPTTSLQTASPTTNASPKPDDVLSRADALLAAAATPKKADTGKRLNYLIGGITLIIFIGLGIFLVSSLFKPSQTTTASPSVTTSDTPKPASTSPTPSNQTDSSKRDTERKETLNDISTALSAYKKTNGTYPVGDDISVLVVLTASDPPYISEIKDDPLNDADSGVVVNYGYSSDGTKFTLTAALENKQDPDAANGLYIVKGP
jgi:hypothetical protein